MNHRFALTLLVSVCGVSAFGYQSISNTFDGEFPAKNTENDFPGRPGNGWMTPWLTPSIDAKIYAAIDGATPLGNGDGKNLYVQVSAREDSPFYGVAGRAFNGDSSGVPIDAPHRINFEYRLDTALEEGQWLTLFASGEGQASTDARCTWIIRGSKDGWRVVNGNRNGGVTKEIDTGMPVVPRKVYQFSLYVKPENREWFVKISDGSRTYESSSLGFRAPRLGGQGDIFLNFGAQGEAGSPPIGYSIDNINIERSN